LGPLPQMNRLLGHRYSHETISAMTEEVLQAVEAFRRRPLPEEMAFVYLDGLYLKLLREGEGVVREVVYVALGVTPSGERRVLGYWLLPAESALGWEGVLGELWQRGLRRVLLFITDGLPGLPEAIRRVYPQAEWQRCVVHGVRWSLGQVRARDRTLLAEDLRRVYGAESRGEALEALEALREAWGARYPGVVALWAGDSGAFLRFYGYPKVLWAVLAEHQPDGEVHSGDPAGDEGARPQVSQRGGGVQAPLPGVGEARREVGGEEA
jgi:putative transposase